MYKTKLLTAKSLLLTAFLLSVYCIPLSAQTDTTLSTITAVTSLGITDYIPLQRDLSGTYTWRRITGASMWDRITDTTEARITTLLNASNSWNGINDFDGATFNSGSHGKVLFNGDSVVVTTSIWALWLQRYSASAIIGNYNAPFFNIYAKTFTVINSGETDSVNITVDSNGKLSIPNLTVTETMSIDSSASFNVIAYTPHEYTVPNIGDTLLTLTSTDRYSMIELDLPGNMNPGISRIYVQGAQKGMVLRLYNMDASYAAKFNDYVGNDDNLYLSAGFDFGQYDYLELMCVVESIIGQTWIETGRSNN